MGISLLLIRPYHPTLESFVSDSQRSSGKVEEEDGYQENFEAEERMHMAVDVATLHRS